MPDRSQFLTDGAYQRAVDDWCGAVNADEAARLNCERNERAFAEATAKLADAQAQSGTATLRDLAAYAQRHDGHLRDGRALPDVRDHVERGMRAIREKLAAAADGE